MIKVFRYRVKSHLGELNRQARAVNFVWNFCNDTQSQSVKWDRRWPTGFDLTNLTSGSCKELGLLSKVVIGVCEQYARSRDKSRRRALRYRGKRSLGWIPIKSYIKAKGKDGFHFAGLTYRVFLSRPLPEGKIKDGSSFSRDARGNWFLNLVVEMDTPSCREPLKGIGIDLGLKEFAALSNGEKIDNPRHFRAAEDRLAKAQRAGKKRQAKKIHAGISNSRMDFLHKLSTKLVREFDFIAVGNVNAAALAKTKMAKSVQDASWSSFRNMLRYKAITHGAWYEEVNERFSTQTCSSCGCLPPERPKGIAGLGIRQWVCSGCGAVHDRDVNAAKNLLARSGHRAPVEGTLTELSVEGMSN